MSDSIKDTDTLYFFNPVNNSVGNEGEFLSIIKKELRLINPLIMLLPNISVKIEHFDVTLEFSHDCVIHNSFHCWSSASNRHNYVVWNKFQQTFASVDGSNITPINVTQLAKNFYERINKFVLQHASE